MKIFDVNKDKLTDVDKIEAGMNLLIPQFSRSRSFGGRSQGEPLHKD